MSKPDWHEAITLRLGDIRQPGGGQPRRPGRTARVNGLVRPVIQTTVADVVLVATRYGPCVMTGRVSKTL
jgi:hypothetical protein